MVASRTQLSPRSLRRNGVIRSVQNPWETGQYTYLYGCVNGLEKRVLPSLLISGVPSVGYVETLSQNCKTLTQMTHNKEFVTLRKNNLTTYCVSWSKHFIMDAGRTR